MPDSDEMEPDVHVPAQISEIISLYSCVHTCICSVCVCCILVNVCRWSSYIWTKYMRISAHFKRWQHGVWTVLRLGRQSSQCGWCFRRNLQVEFEDNTWGWRNIYMWPICRQKVKWLRCLLHLMDVCTIGNGACHRSKVLGWRSWAHLFISHHLSSLSVGGCVSNNTQYGWKSFQVSSSMRSCRVLV